MALELYDRYNTGVCVRGLRVIVLGLDPSINATGYVVYDTKNKSILCYGVIYSPEKNPELSAIAADGLRIHSLSKQLVALVEAHGIQEVWSETPLGAQSFKAAQALFSCKGIVIAIANSFKLPYRLVHPKLPKKFLTGDLNATKGAVEQAIRDRLPILDAALPRRKNRAVREAVFDALAVTLYFDEGNPRSC